MDHAVGDGAARTDDPRDAEALTRTLGRRIVPPQLLHVRHMPERGAVTVPWPERTPAALAQALGGSGVLEPWRHKAEAAALAAAGTHVVLATGTASGKSLGYQLAAGTALHEDPTGAVLYLAPTKALAADQLQAWRALARDGATWLRPAPYDGDTDPADRKWAREHANVLLTNPDMLHVGILPHHERWSRFFRRLRYVVVDEAHVYRGVFGSHVAVLLRRLARVCAHYRSGRGEDGGNAAGPVFIGASATSADPAGSFSRLIGAEAEAVTRDASPHGAVTVGFWEPELTDRRGENGAPVRRSATAEGAGMMADLAVTGTRTIAFIRSRRGAEAMASAAKRELAEVDPSLPPRVAAYRAGYLPEERREVETALRTGRLLGVASTPALELGIDIAGLDAVLVAGWPGTRASFFQQVGRAGRAGQESVALYVAGDDPLDTYVVHHPEAVFELAVEDSVTDPANPHILAPHLCAAAAELPLVPDGLDAFGDPEQVRSLVEQLVEEGYLRRRPAGWFWTHPEHAAGLVSLRDDGGGPTDIIDTETGALLGTMGSPQTHYQAHPGAVYVHQDRTYLVEDLDEDAHAVLVSRASPDYFTQARDITEIEVLDTVERLDAGDLQWCTGPVKVTTQVVSYQRKALVSGEVLGEEPLELPARDLFTTAVWFHCPSETLVAAGLTMDRLPGSLHAAEHAMIGLLPIVASNDRWDIGGVSMALHPDTGQPSVFVYDGHPGGAGFAERGFHEAEAWLQATLDTVRSCACPSGCPSCVQSPKCGNRNNPLDKAGAATLLAFVLNGVRAAGARTRQPGVPRPGGDWSGAEEWGIDGAGGPARDVPSAGHGSGDS